MNLSIRSSDETAPRPIPNPDDALTRSLKVVTLVILSLVLAAVAGLFLMRILPIVIVLIGATFFAYLIYPAVNRLQRLGLARWLAIALLYLALAVILGGGLTFAGPTIYAEAQTLTHDLPNIIARTRATIIGANASVLAAIPLGARTTAANLLDQFIHQLQGAAGGMAGRALQIALSVVTAITGLIIVPILAFYILLDSDRLREMAVGLFPGRLRSRTLSVLHDIDVVVGGFIRGQIIVGAVVAVLITILLLILHVKYALLIGLFAGVVDIIPYVGAFAGAIPAVIIAFVTHGPGTAALTVLGFAAVYEIEGHLVAPAVVGNKVGLSPLIVIIAILIGAEIGGIAGMFVSVPVAGIIRVLWKRFSRPQVVLHDVEPTAEVPESAIAIVKE
ncbi:MAG: AI-2E family transporter [Candidatus Eremiobacteraeota bacterium]|nr:AI-2E family transporter [Candidatus Eremiobacteraeota bacterium]MBC5826504.1 AI-2E family transporter [Candidatus Eremiobacteraeota bacterium]